MRFDGASLFDDSFDVGCSIMAQLGHVRGFRPVESDFSDPWSPQELVVSSVVPSQIKHLRNAVDRTSTRHKACA